MANGDREVNLRLSAEDDASQVIDDVADALDDLDEETTVAVDADTRDALSAIDRFDASLDGLTDEAREIRLEFKRAQLERDLRSALRDLERLEDPVEIDARSGDLEQVLGDLEDLDRLASEKYEIDLDVDPARSARQAADDVDAIRQRGEGMQSAIPAIRGFGDELGGTAQSAGIASQAVADLGDFALIAGERFTASGSRMSGAATRIGTALGSLGLAGAVGGIAIQLSQSLLPTIGRWIGLTDDATAAQNELETSLDGVAAALRKNDYEAAIREFINSNEDLIASGEEFGATTEDIVRYMFGLGRATNDSVVPNINSADQAFQDWSQTMDGTRDELNGTVTALTKADDLAALLADDVLANEIAGLSAADAMRVLARNAGVAGRDGVAAFDDMSDAADDATGAVEDVNSAYDELVDDLEDRKSYRDLQDAFGDVRDAAFEAWTKTEAGADDAREAQQAYDDALLDLQLRTAAYIKQLDGVPDERATEILALIDEGSLAEADRRLRILTLPRSVQITINERLSRGDDRDVGLIDPGGTNRSALSTPSTTVNVNLPRSADARDVTRELNRWARINGGQP